ncbi:MAG TPA: hypothetical protein PKY40_04175 [Burkholderiaceae bacterium]|nr:hypothetical protein [Burkholderiaceae bacterium]
MVAPMPFKPKVTEADLDARISEWRAAWRQAEEAGNPFGQPVNRVRLNVGAAAVIAFLAAFWICVATAIEWGID